MNKPQTLPVEGIKVKKSQTEQFAASVKSILSGTAHHKPVIFSVDNLVSSAIIVTNSPLSGDQMRSLCNLADSWNQEMMIGRGPLASIIVEFNLKQQ